MRLRSLFEDKSVLITGHTGFKGSWLAAWLFSLGARVTGVAQTPPSNPSHFEVAGLADILEDHRIDIRNGDELKRVVSKTQPDFVFHLAAQSLVRESYLRTVETYQTNVMGTLNLLEALRDLKKFTVAILITSDKCYDNLEWIWGYRETDKLGGKDPYSASKGSAELLIRSHVDSFFPKVGKIRIGVGRAGNVIGGGDWALDRVVPDCIRSWAKGECVKLRNPHATRPWQHVLEPLSGYLSLANELHHRNILHGEAFNFGPPGHQNHSVLELVQSMSRYWDKVCWEEISDSDKLPYESGLLKLNCDKALHYLHWESVLSFNETLRMTTEWYRSFYENPSKIRNVTLSHIKNYENHARDKEMEWVK